MLRSIETGNLCWWHNIGISFLDRDVVSDNPQWRWTDNQYKFKDKWVKTCEQMGYTMQPCRAEFGAKNQVTLSLRRRYDFLDNAPKPEKTFVNWKKVTNKDMKEFYNQHG